MTTIRTQELNINVFWSEDRKTVSLREEDFRKLVELITEIHNVIQIDHTQTSQTQKEVTP